MIKLFLILNIILTTFFISTNIIFLDPVSAEVSYQNKFGLNLEDVRIIRYDFLRGKADINFKSFPKSISRSVNYYYAILYDRKNPRWSEAYLFLLTIVPELFEEEIGC